ncbi:unnamed protein product [Arabis nemorensis]|uniref:Secreted protein n=1 Tax=Arabis nemorensis TaxID=586526 RepID=A0A565BB21_9BRAS|nr:unnamed protein product [Arabis nemorensis]
MNAFSVYMYGAPCLLILCYAASMCRRDCSFAPFANDFHLVQQCVYSSMPISSHQAVASADELLAIFTVIAHSADEAVFSNLGYAYPVVLIRITHYAGHFSS